jgi:YVTN family beta-propeller protein
VLRSACCPARSRSGPEQPGSPTSATVPSDVSTRPPNRVTRIAVGSQPTDVAVAFGSVWVPCLGRNAVWRIGARTGKVEAIIPTGGEPLAVAAGAGAIWVTNQAAGTISRIDPGTKTVVKTVRVGFNPHGLAFARGAVWVAVAKRLI